MDKETMDRITMDEVAFDTHKRLESLMEVLNIDQDELKKKMVIKALEEGASGYGTGYVGPLFSDALDVINKLQSERDEAVKDLEASRELVTSRTKQRDKFWQETSEIHGTLLMADIGVDIPDKRKFKREEVVGIRKAILDNYYKLRRTLMDILK